MSFGPSPSSLAWSAPRTLSHSCLRRWSPCPAHPHAATADDVPGYVFPPTLSSELGFSNLDFPPSSALSSQEGHPHYEATCPWPVCVCVWMWMHTCGGEREHPRQGRSMDPTHHAALPSPVSSRPFFSPAVFCILQAPRALQPHLLASLEPKGTLGTCSSRVSHQWFCTGTRVAQPWKPGSCLHLYSQCPSAAVRSGPRSLHGRLPGNPAETAGRTGRCPRLQLMDHRP